MAKPPRRFASDPGIYFDKLGLIVQRDGDGGDTAQREGFVWFGKYVYKQVTGTDWPVQLPLALGSTLDLLEARPGEFRRHPTQIDPKAPDPNWKVDPDASSRDQVTPLVAAMGVWEDQARLQRVWTAKRPCQFVFTCIQGTQDVFSPTLTNLWRRAVHQPPDLGSDQAMLLGTETRIVVASQNPNDVSDDLNTVVELAMAKLRSPTQYSDQAATEYAERRSVSSGSYIQAYRKAYPGDFESDEATMVKRIDAGIASGWKPECPPVLGALRWYFRAETGGCSNLAELYAPIIHRWLS